MQKKRALCMDKKGISIMIGYILLITGAVVMGAIIYNWMQSYVPKDTLDCPDGVSLFITDAKCIQKGSDYQVRVTVKNNGRFDVGGYFIHATDSPEQTLAAIDLSKNLVSGGEVYNNAILFLPLSQGLQNFFKPTDDDLTSVFNYPEELYKVELIPVRFQIEENRNKLVSCGDAKIVEKLNCQPEAGSQEEIIPEDCVPDCANKECGSDGCGGACGDLSGACADGYNCETETGTCVEDLCGNGVIDEREECDGVTGCGDNCLHLEGYSCISEVNLCALV